MKKFLLTRVVITIVFGLNFSTVDVPIVSIGQNSFQIQSDNEFEILFDHGLSNRDAGTSFQSVCLETYEHLSFGEIPLVDVSDVTLNSNKSHSSADSLGAGTAWDNNNLDSQQAI